MKMGEIVIDKLDPNIATMHIKVKTTKRLRIRFWIATELIMLAAKILGCGIEIEESDVLR